MVEFNDIVYIYLISPLIAICAYRETYINQCSFLFIKTQRQCFTNVSFELYCFYYYNVLWGLFVI